MNTGYDVAKEYIGLQEHRDRDKLMELFKMAKIMNPEYPNEVFDPDGMDKHGLPWCAVWVTFCERDVLGPSVRVRYTAREFLDYGEDIGKDLTKAKEGDILIFSRGNNTYEGHVTYYTGIQVLNSGTPLARCLGGNQNDSVSIAFHRIDTLLGIRRVNYEETD